MKLKYGACTFFSAGEADKGSPIWNASLFYPESAILSRRIFSLTEKETCDLGIQKESKK